MTKSPVSYIGHRGVNSEKCRDAKRGSAVSMIVLFVCPCCANFWSVYAHRMCIGALETENWTQRLRQEVPKLPFFC